MSSLSARDNITIAEAKKMGLFILATTLFDNHSVLTKDKPQTRKELNDLVDEYMVCDGMDRVDVLINMRTELSRRVNLLSESINSELKKEGRRDGYGRSLVYCIEVDGLIKIGYSSRYKSRMQSYGPHKTLLVIDGPIELERAIHAQLSPFCVRGKEYYQDCSPVRERIEVLRSQFKDVQDELDNPFNVQEQING